MATTSVEAVKQNVTRMMPSAFKLLGLTKLECIPGGGVIAGSLIRSIFGFLFVKIIFAEVMVQARFDGYNNE